jgi:transposase InsO family protein
MREAYGARKRWHLLTRAGRVGGCRLRRLAGIVAWRRRRSVRTVQVWQQETPAIPNRRNQPFAVSAKNRGWTGDLTFVPTRTGG